MKSFANDDAVKGKDPVNILRALLKELSIPVTDATVRDSVLSHPYYPSLLSVSESLERWGLDTLALDLSASVNTSPSEEISPSALSQLPCPFLAHCPLSGADPYFIITGTNEEGVICMDGRRRQRSLSYDEFSRIWDGKVLVMERKEPNGEPGYLSMRRVERWNRLRIPLLLAVLLVPMIAAAWQFVTTAGKATEDKIYFLVLSIGNILGLATTMLLLGLEFGKGSASLHRWCSLSKKMSCAAVVHDRRARLSGGISWSELGFVYFAGSLIYGCLGEYYALSLAPLVLSGFLSVGYIAFSLLYQGLVIRKWCLFCLIVLVILLGEWLAAMLTGQTENPGNNVKYLFARWTFMEYVLLLFAYIIPAVCWMLWKPYWLGAREAKVLRQELNRFKRNEVIFQSLLSQEKSVGDDPQHIGLTVGNAAAENSLLVVSSPFCAPCARTHQKVEHLLEVNPRWKARIIFSTVDEDVLAAKLIGYFIGVESVGGEAALRRALHEWYEDQVYKEVEKKDETDREIAAMRYWCIREDIRYTPTVYVNGRLLPELYDIEDLQYL